MNRQDHLKPWDDTVALMGEHTPKNTGQVEWLIQYLLSVHKRFGNTAVVFERLRWGASALWARSEYEERLAKLTELTDELKAGTERQAVRIADLVNAQGELIAERNDLMNQLDRVELLARDKAVAAKGRIRKASKMWHNSDADWGCESVNPEDMPFVSVWEYIDQGIDEIVMVSSKPTGERVRICSYCNAKTGEPHDPECDAREERNKKP